MLQQVLEHIHNHFVRERYKSTYTISGGVLPLPALVEGQRFWVTGSAMNDGVYTYHATGVKTDDDGAFEGFVDETFTGTICTLSVPRQVIDIAGEISAWATANADAMTSPYQSESVIGVYSYTKAGGTDGSNAPAWAGIFGGRLNPWRKVHE